jgi:hypothetical protein
MFSGAYLTPRHSVLNPRVAPGERASVILLPLLLLAYNLGNFLRRFA